MPLEITPPSLPSEYETFARAVAELAKQNNIRDFTLLMRVESPLGQRLFGEVKAVFFSKDGRGRPSENLKILIETTLELDLIKNPTSYG